MTYLFFFFCRAFPQKARSLLRGGTEKKLPPPPPPSATIHT